MVGRNVGLITPQNVDVEAHEDEGLLDGVGDDPIKGDNHHGVGSRGRVGGSCQNPEAHDCHSQAEQK